MELIEVNRDKVFHHGEIIKVGNYWIGWDLVFGIHIPTNSQYEAKNIMKEINDTKTTLEEIYKLVRSWNQGNMNSGAFAEELNEICGDNVKV